MQSFAGEKVVDFKEAGEELEEGRKKNLEVKLSAKMLLSSSKCESFICCCRRGKQEEKEGAVMGATQCTQPAPLNQS